jgi:hypothetical protein
VLTIKDSVSIARRLTMSEIKVIEIEEHEDGSATLQVECDPETFMAIFDVGFVTLIKAGLDKEKEEDG